MLIRFIDLFSGMGGFRLGFEQAVFEKGLRAQCVFSSEIKPYAVKVYQDNFSGDIVHGDIKNIEGADIPDFDVLLAGFPCQAFSAAGKRQGFLDTRGTLFFEIERVLKEKQPKGFILENVEGLVRHDLEKSNDTIGQTLKTILFSLEKLGYFVSWKILDARHFGVPQQRKRVFIVGTKSGRVNLDGFAVCEKKLEEVLERGRPILTGSFIDALLSKYKIEELYGKSVKDKRGGKNNIHSWNIELKGTVTREQIVLLEKIMRARRNKKWAEIKGIAWMDGMPLTLSEIRSFCNLDNLQEMLEDLYAKKYLKLEYPKDLVSEVDANGNVKKRREYRTDLEKGYNIVAGKLSYEINKILNPKDIAPTLVATDLDRVAVPDNHGLRMLTDIEKRRLFGFPDDFKMNVNQKEIVDLFGNTVVVPVVKSVASRVLDIL